MTRVLAVVVLVVAILACMGWVLGHDAVPAGTVLRTKAHDQLVDVIGKEEVAVQRARSDYEAAMQAAEQLQHRLAEAKAKAGSIDRKVEIAKSELQVPENEVHSIGKAVKEKQPIRFVDGTEATMQQVAQRLEMLKPKLEMLRFKVKEFEGVANQHRAALAEVEHKLQEAPVKLSALKGNLELCEARLAMVRELKDLYKDPAVGSDDGFTAMANRAKESIGQADDGLKAALAGVGSLQMASTLDKPLVTEQQADVNAESLLKLIESMRNTQTVVVNN